MKNLKVRLLNFDLNLKLYNLNKREMERDLSGEIVWPGAKFKSIDYQWTWDNKMVIDY